MLLLFNQPNLQRHIETESNTFFLSDDKQANRELLREGVKGMLDKVRTEFMDSIQNDVLQTLSIPRQHAMDALDGRPLSTIPLETR
jgi:hypothetical protein